MFKKFALGTLCLFWHTLVVAGTWNDFLREGKVDMDLRYRFEFVDQDGFDKDAKASTLRIRLGYTTGKAHHLQAHVDFEGIQEAFIDDFNNTDNGKTEYPVVADPEDAEINQAFVTFDGITETVLKFGRQRIKLDNDRFVGNVGWRQNEQTYDAYTLLNQSLPKTKLCFSLINNVNRIFGEHHSGDLGNLDVRAMVGHAGITTDYGTCSIYGHWIENQDAPGGSHQNLGIRWAGKVSLAEERAFNYGLEYAVQSDYKDGSDLIDADYLHGNLGFLAGKFDAGLGYETLGSDGSYAFATPLATLHAFNGWADKFLSTPVNGLIDMYLSFGYKTRCGDMPTVFKLVVHDFQSDASSLDYGSEIDAFAKLVISKKSDVMLKVAAYSADDFATDTTKIWFQFHCKL